VCKVLMRCKSLITCFWQKIVEETHIFIILLWPLLFVHKARLGIHTWKFKKKKKKICDCTNFEALYNWLYNTMFHMLHWNYTICVTSSVNVSDYAPISKDKILKKTWSCVYRDPRVMQHFCSCQSVSWVNPHHFLQ
jgi:hypothetical protein